MTGDQTDTRPWVLFVHLGAFSGSNAGLLAALKRKRPDLHFETLDLKAEMRASRIDFSRIALSALAEYGFRGVLRKSTVRTHVNRSRAFFDRARAIVRKRLEGRVPAFVFQTQSLFDASVNGIPNYVYTDHAALALPRSEMVEVPSDAFLEREGRIYRNAEHVFTFGPKVHETIVGKYGVPSERVTIVGSGINVEPNVGFDTDPARYRRREILFVGKDWKRKGGPDLLEAFGIVRRTCPDATLTVIGPSEAVTGPGIEFLGRLHPEEVGRHFARASCFCLPSHREPFGIVIAEAMHHALPVVATRVGEIPGIVEEEVTGYLVEPRAPEEMAQALLRLLQDADRSAAFGRAGLKRASRFTWDHVASEMNRHFPAQDDRI